MTPDETVETVVVGAGVIGLAIARELARAGHEVIIIEAEEKIGTQTSSRNSEVIHAGLYYAPGSLKARLCVEGRDLLYEYLEAHSIDHVRCGKMIVACDAQQQPALDHIERNALTCGVDSLRRLDQQQIHARAPAVRAIEALWSPESGIVDSHGLMRHLLRDAQAADASLALATRVETVTPGHRSSGFVVHTADFRLGCRNLVNAAGLGAHILAEHISQLPRALVPTQYLAKGSYFSSSSSPALDCLVYPVPASASLGIHATIDLAHQVRWGPDQEWIDTVDYTLDPARAKACERAVRKFIDLPPETTFEPTYAGIRPKLQAPGTPKRDFMIQGPADHQLPGLINLFGMESPGLTACLSIANYVRSLLSPSSPAM